jgi:glycerate kinase
VTILIAPDKFKGSMTAQQVCAAIENGIHQASDSIHVISIPLADGGEGTAELLTQFSNGMTINTKALDPLGRPLVATYGMSRDNRTAFIEMAKISGLQLLKSNERGPLNTTTFGTGQLIKDALSRGVSEIILGIGGSATNDAGIGMAAALGFSFHDSEGHTLNPIGRSLVNIASIKTGDVAMIRQAKFIVLCDVDNPLYGEHGAAFVFGAQKGASPTDVALLDDGLRNFEKVVRLDLGRQTNFPGAGAAGGMGAGTKVFLNASMSNGFDFISGFTNLEEQVRAADLVITGEGKIDSQTLSGKVVKGVSQLASQYGKRCVAFAGDCELSEKSLRELHVEKVITVLDESINLQEAMQSAPRIIETKANAFIRGWMSMH